MNASSGMSASPNRRRGLNHEGESPNSASVLIPKYCAFDPSFLVLRAPQARLEGRSRAQRRRYCMLDHPSRRRAARGPQDEVGALPRRPTAPANRTNLESRTPVAAAPSGKSAAAPFLPDRLPIPCEARTSSSRGSSAAEKPVALSRLGPVSARPAYDQNRTSAGWSNGNSAASVTRPFSTLKTTTTLVSTVFPFRSPLFLCRAKT
jgi:hypothetical protein